MLERFLLRWAPEPVLSADGVCLRPLNRSDYGAWQAALRGDEKRFRAVQPTWSLDHLDLGTFQRRVARYRRLSRHGRGFIFAIVDAASRDFVGEIELAPVHGGAFQKATIGYWIAKNHRGQGHARAAVRAVTAFAFDTLGLARLEAVCLPDNAASAAVLKAEGFQAEGTLVSYLEIDEVRRDHKLFARVAPTIVTN